MAQPPEPSAALVIVGNEVLSGKVEDQNTPFLLGRLRNLGVPVTRVTVVPDRIEAMVEVYRASLAAAQWVFSTGGVGPTHDDVTMDAVAAAFGVELAEHEELAAIIRDFFGERCTPAHLKMARLPTNAELIWGDGLKFPVVLCERLHVFPGQPGLMRAKFLGIEERYRSAPIHLRRVYLKADEGEVAELLEAAERSQPGVEVGSYPVWGTFDHSILVTIEGRDPAAVEAVEAAIVEGVPAETLVRRE